MSTGLTADEAKALFVLFTDRAHADLGLGPAIGSALRKVMAALPEPHREAADLVSRRILVDPVRWRSGPPRSAPHLGVLQDAVFTDRRLRLRYRHGYDDRVRSYTLDPYGLVDKAGVWYLVADRRGQPRLFRVDRVLAATVAEDPVQRRTGVELAEVWDTLRRQVDQVPAEVRVVVRVRHTSLARFLRIDQADLATPQSADALPAPDDIPEHTELEVRFRSLGAAQQLLAFGTEVEVVSPAEVRESLWRVAEEIAARYATGRREGLTP